MRLFKDYEFKLQFHLGKANVVADALSRKSLHIASMMVEEAKMLEYFKDIRLFMIVLP